MSEQQDWLREVTKHIPDMPQRQDSTTDQLRDLVCVAQRLGLYDAADIVKQFLQR